MRAGVCILGHFGEGKNLLNGQTVKTKIIAEELQNQLGEDQVLKIDTHGGWKTLLKAPFQTFKALKNSKNVLILPAHNGLRVYAPLLSFQKMFFKKRKLHYVMIGGWLPEFLKKRRLLAKMLKRFDGIYAETVTVRDALAAQGFDNVFVMPNCKKLTVLDEGDIVYHKSEPYRVCTFSRVSREKGIEDAVNAIKSINESLGRTAYTLDIYGQVDSGQVDWFESLKAEFPSYVSYGGLVPFDKSVETVKDYFALLFPTHYYTEGIPGTIIDAYAAGVPVVSARWESFSDIIEDGVTGIGYELGSVEALTDVLMSIQEKPDRLNVMKKSCLEHAERFLPKIAIGIVTRNFA